MTGEIIGRDVELNAIHAFLDRPADGLRALVLGGEPGIGKSTLWLAGAAASRARSFQVLTSRPAETEQTLAFVVLGDLFGETQAEALATLPAPRRHAFDSALLREEPNTVIDPRALGVAILTLLPAIADGRPLVLAIDDDQWMDPSSRATLAFALRRSARQPVLLLLSRRLDNVAAMGLEEVLDPAAVERLTIGALNVGAIQQILQRRTGVMFARPTLKRLHEESAGNPFYALELAHAQRMDPFRDATLPLLVPASLERLVGARIDTLDQPTRQALLLIAAHGRFPVGLLRTMEVVPQALDKARATNLIETRDGVVRFTHPLLASAAYRAASLEDRRTAHRRLAMASDDPLDRGRHLALAADEPDEELAAALETAASAAHERGLPIAAAELGEHAIRLTPFDAREDRHRRSIATALAHMEAGEGSRARSIADDLLAEAPRAERRAEALILRSDVEPHDPGGAVALLREALVEAAGAPSLRAAIHGRLAEAGRFTKGRAWAESHAQASLRLADWLDDDALRATALSLLARLHYERCDPSAIELAKRAYALATGLADPRPLSQASWTIGDLLTWSGDVGPTREWLEGRLADWIDRDERVRPVLLRSLAFVELRSGHWDLASEYASQVNEINAQYGWEFPQDLFPTGLVALHRGEFRVAREHAKHGLGLAREQQLPYFAAMLGICDLWTGSPSAALTYFVEAERAADTRGWDEPSLRWWRAEHVEALLEVGRIDDARRLVNGWESTAERLGRGWVLALAMRCRGLIAAARGELPAALELLERAAARHAAVGDPFGQARALLALGMVRRRARQKRTARAALEAALAGFEALGASSWATTTRDELARIGGRERIEGLSPSERRVATLVAEGRTNREIASELFLGERTVAGHLTRIYSKLGVRSRTELARKLLPLTEESAGGTSKVETS